jgi:hypothetical protein
MAEISKQALKVDNNQSFPNNNNGAITPSILRAFNVNMIDSLVDELGYNVDSASWNQQITALESFTSSQQPSFTALNSFTASQLVINSNVNAFTQSAAASISNLNAYTASYVPTIGIYDENTFVNNAFAIDFNGNGITASYVSSKASVTVDFTKLNAATASQQISINNLNTTTASLLVETQNLELFSASALTSISNLNASSASQQVSINNLNTFTASAAGLTTGSLLVTASFDNGTRNLTFTKGDASTFNVNIPDVSGSSGNFATTGSNTFTGNQTVSASILLTGNVEMNQDVNAGILYPMSGSKSVRIQKQVGINRLSWVDQDNDKLLYLDVDSGVFFVSGNFQAGLQNGYAWVGQADGYSGQVATSSFGSTINTGSFATTGSNTFTGVQNFTADITASNTFINGDLTVLPNTVTNLNGNTNVQSFLYVGGGLTLNTPAEIVWVDTSGSIGSGFSASVDARINAITGSGGSVNTGSLMVTGSISGNTLTFTKGDASTFDIIIPSASGSVFDTGSFATTGSNTFNGDQSITGSVSVFLPKASGEEFRVSWGNAGSASMFTEESGGPIQSLILVSASIDLRRGGIDFTSGSIRNSGDQIQFNASPSASFILRTQNGGVAEMTAFTDFTDLNRPYGQVRASSDGSLLLRGNGGSITLTGSALTMQGFTYPTTDGTSGQVLTTNGSKVLSFTTISGGGGTAFANPSVESISGSLLITANTFTSGAANLSHLTASAQNQSNLVFKDNNLTGTTIISGSNNIFTNPTAPAAGRINYIGGASNLFLNGQADQLPTITGSAASVSGNRPVMNANIIAGTQTWAINQAVNPGSHTYSNNILAGATTWTFNTLGNTGGVTVNNNLSLGATMTLNSPSRSIAQINAGESGSNALTVTNNSIAGTLNYQGPVSSSTHTIQQNSIAGTVNFNVQSSSRAITATANIINGILGFNDNTVFAPTLGSGNSILNNNINGTATFTLAGSSSFNVANNNLNTVTITSFLDASAVTNAAQRFSGLNANAVFGLNNNILFSGSQGAAPTARNAIANLIAGQFISASLIGDGSGSNMVGTAILGGGLNVIGTTTIPAAGIQQNYGSAFFGRWNATDGNKASTAQTILAVGTGTSGSAGIVRKTGFLIDSGSNSFFEGAVNVSGSLTVQSGSTFFANGNQQFNVGAFSSLITQSGSANVSQSVTFDTTDKAEGVSLVSNSQITFANAGTYSLTFSAQCDPETGAGDLYIWLKKNGTNVANSATKLSLANNAAQLMTVNFVIDAAASDYYELVWESDSGDIILLTEAASGNIPAIPSVILTATQVR